MKQVVHWQRKIQVAVGNAGCCEGTGVVAAGRDTTDKSGILEVKVEDRLCCHAKVADLAVVATAETEKVFMTAVWDHPNGKITFKSWLHDGKANGGTPFYWHLIALNEFKKKSDG